MPAIYNPVTGTRASVSDRQLSAALAGGWRLADEDKAPSEPSEKPTKAPARRRSTKPKSD